MRQVLRSVFLLLLATSPPASSSTPWFIEAAAASGLDFRVGTDGLLRLEFHEAASDGLSDELKKFVSHEISPIARPDKIQFAPGLPKTRSGKIMRRILRKIAEGDTSSLGDTSTLADPSVVNDLVKNAKR